MADHIPLLSALERQTGKVILTAIEIPEDCKEEIVEELRSAGKDPFSVFPDVQGLVQLATGKYFESIAYWTNERRSWNVV